MYQLLPIELGVYELVMWLLYVTIGGLIVYLYKSFNEHKNLHYLMPAYFIKIIGGFSFAMIYVFYYTGQGDTIEYFRGSKQLADFFWDSPGLYFELIKSNYLVAQDILSKNNEFIRFSLSEEEWFMLKIISPLNILGLRSYLGLTFFMSFISFIGAYKMYQLMVELTSTKYKNVIFSINFFIPSVLLQGSGVLKDTITLASFSFVVYFFYQLSVKNKINFKNVFFLLFFSFIIFNLKAYILISFIIWAFLTVFLVIMNKSENPVVKFLFFPYLIMIIFLFGYFSLKLLLDSSSDYKQDILFNKIEGFQQYHATLGGSYYTLGEIEYTQLGLLKKLPQALNVTLFRPYPWESNSVLVLMNSLESIFLFIYLIFVTFKFKFSFFKQLSKNPFLIGAFVFCLLFAFFIGITSYNFGALSRFKIPIVALFYFILYYIYIKKKENYYNGLK